MIFDFFRVGSGFSLYVYLSWKVIGQAKRIYATAFRRASSADVPSAAGARAASVATPSH